MSALISRMILALLAASNFSSFTLKIVFSFGLSSSAASAAAGAAAGAAAAEAAGIAISVMFSRVCDGQLAGLQIPSGQVPTFKAVTSSETSSKDSVEIESTMGAIFALGSASRARGEAENARRMGCVLDGL